MAAASSSSPSAPRLRIRPADGRTTAVALILHGGKARSGRAASPRQLSAVRMTPFARGLHRAGREAGLAVWSLGYRDRGWATGREDAEGSQVQDTQWALDRIGLEHPGAAIYLVGHSLGGRIAFAAGGDPRVRGIVALAPWTPEEEAVDQLQGMPVVVVHGRRDRWVAPAYSLSFAARARSAGVDVLRFEIARSGHAMLRRSSLWQGLTTSFVVSWARSVQADRGSVDEATASTPWGLRIPL